MTGAAERTRESPFALGEADRERLGARLAARGHARPPQRPADARHADPAAARRRGPERGRVRLAPPRRARGSSSSSPTAAPARWRRSGRSPCLTAARPRALLGGRGPLARARRGRCRATPGRSQVSGGGPVAVGGFAFAPDGGADPAWAGFEPASLIVPEVDLTREAHLDGAQGRAGAAAGTVRLTLCALAAPDDTAEELLARLRGAHGASCARRRWRCSTLRPPGATGSRARCRPSTTRPRSRERWS